MPERTSEEWERVLWKRKKYPDNLVPATFLSSLSKNPNFKPYTYWSLVQASCAIDQHLATIYTFLTVFVHLKERYLDARLLVWISVCGFIIGYASWELLCCYGLGEANQSTGRAKAIKSSILTFLALMSLSPVLRTLTAATSSDSIWALSAGLFVLNALLADYTALKHEDRHRERLTSVLSMNAAISSSVVLASRLSDDLSVFALMLFSVQLFALFPIMRRHLQNGPAILQVPMTSVLCSSSIFLAAPLSTSVMYLFIITFVFVTFVAPGVLVWAQRYKNEIRGSWDPAVPKVNMKDSSSI
ncbi:phosphatidylinositol N-acetylglucosaminyltransferase [Sparassis latifolia]|uniref:Phosphatidylinositol N-acetylglucosaminyltransferase GPI2 subunit n=1 Tax=Sparassis crispa TaxID=139825 RepID=A0A401G6V6_9APHY|nr:Phosphatidylinositol N-acetylglucosaminyltransferase GPI2 subunit [Sparassis crispa]GBE77900.1 Phosphatidylinositol N-acetylglucosaminyltransferase GPI2 subunit [Sparassis crispa]